jgi:hypothetical protein
MMTGRFNGQRGGWVQGLIGVWPKDIRKEVKEADPIIVSCQSYRLQCSDALLKDEVSMLPTQARQKLFRFRIDNNIGFSTLVNLHLFPI